MSSRPALARRFQITQNLSLDASYVGNFARKMNRLRDANQGIFTGNFDGSGNPIDTYPYANLNTTNSSATGSHAFLELATNDGNSNYNALLVSLRRRLLEGYVLRGQLHLEPQHLRLCGQSDGQRFSAELLRLRGRARRFDVRRSPALRGFLTYELPVGKGKKYLGEGESRATFWADGKSIPSSPTQTGATIQLFAPDVSLSGGQSTVRAQTALEMRAAGASDDPTDRPLAESRSVCDAGNSAISGIAGSAGITARALPMRTSASSRFSR